MNWLNGHTATLLAAIALISVWLWRHMVHGLKLGRLDQKLDDHIRWSTVQAKYFKDELKYIRSRVDTEALRRMDP